MTKMMRMKISKPNYILAEEKAREFIGKLETKELPVKLISYKTIFNNLEIKKYSWYSKKMGLSMEQVYTDLGSEDGCCVFNERNGKYRILYNDTIENEGRKRWTIAHELGHYALNHHEIYGDDILRRSPINDELYGILEKEANCFARNLLAPPHVIYHLEKPSPEVIQEICSISWEAAIHTYNFIRTGVKEYGRGYSKKYVKELGFDKFLFNINNRYFCRKCRCNFIKDTPSFCPCCGNASISKTHFKFGDDFMVKYAGVEVDHKSRAKICPCCNNEELDYDGDHCIICSAYLINSCANKYDFDDYGNEYLDNQSCGTLLTGNARYCHKCGNTSTFYQNNYLSEWNYSPEKLVIAPF